jgi:transcriptional regulator EpsA
MEVNQLASVRDREAALYVQLAAQAADVRTHEQLWRWLEGHVQQWLPHDAFLVGWGDFERGSMEYDIISSVPGLRSRDFTPAGIAPLLRYLRDCWVAARRAPCQVSLAGGVALVKDCGAATSRALAGLQTALVHGMAERIHGHERMFAALRTLPIKPGCNDFELKLLLPLIDSALHRIPPPNVPGGSRPGAPPRPDLAAADLSEREREIMHWVALGKTNPEIGCILSISEFTVKNHLKSIFAKLDVTNRAQAVAQITRVGTYA